MRQRHQELIERQRAEPVDSTWAPNAGKGLGGTLSTVAERMGAQLIQVECATTSCRATFEWDGFAEAQESYSAILHADYEPNCAVQIVLREAQDKSASYQATAVFNCENARAAVQ